MNQFNIIYYLREFYTTHVNYLREQHIKIYIRVKKKPPDFSGDSFGALRDLDLLISIVSQRCFQQPKHPILLQVYQTYVWC
jgi:hypothetical protein